MNLLERLLLFEPPAFIVTAERAKQARQSPQKPSKPPKATRTRRKVVRAPKAIPAASEAELLLRQKLSDDDLFESLLDAPLELAPLQAPSRPLPVVRPSCRTECASVPRPCPFVSCRYNLYLDVRNDGVLRLNFPDREPDEMTASCALDLATDGPRTLDAIAALMGMSKERARQLEASGLAQVAGHFTAEDVD